MKKLTLPLIILSLFTGSTVAAIQPIPAPLIKALSKLNLSRPASLNGGSLFVSLNIDSIETLQAKSVVESVCIAYLGLNPLKRTWKAGGIKDVVITNADATQGFVYQDSDRSCELWGKTTGNEGDAFLEDRLSAATFKPQFQ
ncbi:MAG: hypothetical protein E6556_01695 [Pantoea sp.]|nr:hypothetical protein [Pantoea sp.]